MAVRSIEVFGTNTTVIINTINASSLVHTRVALTGINNYKNNHKKDFFFHRQTPINDMSRRYFDYLLSVDASI